MAAVLMPWHTIGTMVLGTAHTFNGFGDQNFIIGLITFAFLFAALLIVGLPLIGMRFLKFGWRDSTMLLFLGGEAALLVIVLTIMHATSLVRASSYDLRLGIHLAFIGAVFVFLGGYLLRMDEHAHAHGESADLLAHPRRTHPPATAAHSLDLSRGARDGDADESKEDARMRLDI